VVKINPIRGCKKASLKSDNLLKHESQTITLGALEALGGLIKKFLI
jgi:hypothetical protein